MNKAEEIILKPSKSYYIFVSLFLIFVIIFFIWGLNNEKPFIILFCIYPLFQIYFGFRTIYQDSGNLVIQNGLFRSMAVKKAICIDNINKVTPNFNSENKIKSIRIDYDTLNGSKSFEIIKDKGLERLFDWLEKRP